MSPPVNLSSRLRTACAAVVAAAGFLAASPRASADSVNLKFDSTASSSSVTVKVNGSQISGIPGPYYWHEVNAPANSPFPNPTTTFCVELTQHISTGSTYTFSTSSVAAGLVAENPSLSSAAAAAKATAISELYAGHYNAAWEKAGFTGSDQSTAFQLALWAIVYDNPSNYQLTGTGAGNLLVQTASQTAISTAQSWLSTLGSQPSLPSNEQLVWLHNSNNQDQLTLIPCTPTVPPPPPPHGVPAPPGVLLGLIGLGGCLFGRGFRRRTATAATA